MRDMLGHLEKVRENFPKIMLALAAVLSFAIIIGGIFFDLDAALVMEWFGFIVGIVFALTFIYVVVAFIIWFLFYPPYVVIAYVVGAFLLLLVLSFVFIKLIGGPVVDIGAMLDPIFSFLK